MHLRGLHSFRGFIRVPVLFGTLISLACSGDLTSDDDDIVAITVSPRQIVLDANGQQGFSALAVTKGGSAIPATVNWETTAGTIDTNGVFTAPSEGGDIMIVATHVERDWLSDTASASVSAPAPPFQVWPHTATMVTTDSLDLQAFSVLSTGDTVFANVVWSASDSSSLDSMGVGWTRLTPIPQAGTVVVTAVDSLGVTDSAVVAVIEAPVASISISPASSTVFVNNTVQFGATVQDAQGNTLNGPAITWSSSDTGVATVDNQGLATAVAAGSASIVVSTGAFSDTATITVSNIPVATVDLSPGSATMFQGDSTQFTIEVRDGQGNLLTGRSISWTSTASSVVSVDTAGLAIGSAAGTASVIATSEGVSDTASVTVNAIPVASVTVAPAADTVVMNSSTVLAAATLDAQGDTLTGRSVSWTSSNTQVATVDSTGTVTGVSLGTVTITATAEGQSGNASVTVIPVPVSWVDLSPTSASVFVGLSVSLTATPRDAQGNALSRTVVWSSANAGVASVDSAGRVTGTGAGTVSIYATSESQTDSAVITVVQPPLPTFVADPASLPAASASLMPDTSAWRQLNVPGMAAGQSYQDPTSGVRVWKATDPSTPFANSTAGHDYGDGPVQVSREWGVGSHTILVRGSMGYWLVDFTRGIGFSNWRTFSGNDRPRRDLVFTFSNNPATPRIAYMYNGSQLIRFNTATMQAENTGNFPRSQPVGKAWLQTDMNDEWFVRITGTNEVTAWNSQTNVSLTRTFSNLDEPHFETNGRYVAVIHGGEGVTIWDLHNNVISPYMQRQGNAPFFHAASVRNAWVSANVDWSAPWVMYRLDPTTSSTPSPSYLGGAMSGNSFGTLFHFAGQWIQPDSELPGGNLMKQWMLAGTHNIGPGVNTPVQGDPGQQDNRTLLQAAVGFMMIDGSDARFLAHTYQLNDNGDYWELPRATISPDGKVVLFDSDMLNSGRADLFVVEVPVR